VGAKRQCLGPQYGLYFWEKSSLHEDSATRNQADAVRLEIGRLFEVQWLERGGPKSGCVIFGKRGRDRREWRLRAGKQAQENVVKYSAGDSKRRPKGRCAPRASSHRFGVVRGVFEFEWLFLFLHSGTPDLIWSVWSGWSWFGRLLQLSAPRLIGGRLSPGAWPKSRFGGACFETRGSPFVGKASLNAATANATQPQTQRLPSSPPSPCPAASLESCATSRC